MQFLRWRECAIVVEMFIDPVGEQCFEIGMVFGLQPGSSRWAELGIGGGRNSIVTSLESPIHRVYLENLVSARYQNTIKIRTIEGFGNRDLFPAPAFESEPTMRPLPLR